MKYNIMQVLSGNSMVPNSSARPTFMTRLRSRAHWAMNGVCRRIGLVDGRHSADSKDETFDANAFRSRTRFRENYQIVARSLLNVIEFETALDLGCANGFLLENFVSVGKRVRGIELSPEVYEVLPDHLHGHVEIGDAVKLGRIGAFDLVCCVEVAEHVPPESSFGLIDTIVSNTAKWIYFTAASPCQPGTGHINCRQQFFWLNEFRKRGAHLDWERTEQFTNAIRGLKPAEWLEWNSLILRVGS